MNRRLAATVIRYLSFSEEIDGSQDSLGDFSERQWQNTFRWLDNANLALYLLRKLRDTQDDRKLPPAVLSRLEQNYSKNRLRVDEMASAFAEVNAAFRRLAVDYAVVKGFSLVPGACPDAYSRQHNDIDYLVDEQSLPMAQQALADVGFLLQKHTPAIKEWAYWKAPVSPSLDPSQQYEGNGRYSIELHMAFWTPEEHGIEIAGTEFSPSRTIDHEWRGLHFRVLPEEEAFLLQVLHTFQHLLSPPARMSWLYEIAYCLHRRANDKSFWQRVDRRTEADALLKHLVAIVTGLAAEFFQAPLPVEVLAWRANLPPRVGVWLENYGWRVAFEKMPAYELDVFSTSKLNLFLHRQFLPDAKLRGDFTRLRLLPWWRRLPSVDDSPGERPRTPSHARPRHRPPVFHRVVYHAGSGLRYLCEIPRWLWLNRNNAAREVPEIAPGKTNKTMNATGSPQSQRTRDLL